MGGRLRSRLASLSQRGYGSNLHRRRRYQHSPYDELIVGLDEIRQMWSAIGAADGFIVVTEVICRRRSYRVVGVEVRSGDPVRQKYPDLWIVLLDAGGRCRWFELRPE
jgi:hypothetical protein